MNNELTIALVLQNRSVVLRLSVLANLTFTRRSRRTLVGVDGCLQELDNLLAPAENKGRIVVEDREEGVHLFNSIARVDCTGEPGVCSEQLVEVGNGSVSQAGHEVLGCSVSVLE